MGILPKGRSSCHPYGGSPLESVVGSADRRPRFAGSNLLKAQAISRSHWSKISHWGNPISGSLWSHEMNIRESALSCRAAAMSSQGLNQPISSKGIFSAAAINAGASRNASTSND